MSTISSSQSALTQQTQSLIDYLDKSSDESSLIGSTSSTAVKSNALVKKQVTSYSSGVSSSAGKAALQMALQEISEEKKGKITYNDLKKYQEDLESSFSLLLRIDVMEKGVDPSQPFSLKLDAEGKVSVECDDSKSKTIIEKYLKENETEAKKFAYIQALSNLDRARQVNGSSENRYSKESASIEYQSSLISSFFDDALESNFSYASLRAEFKGASQDTSFYTGLNISV